MAATRRNQALEAMRRTAGNLRIARCVLRSAGRELATVGLDVEGCEVARDIKRLIEELESVQARAEGLRAAFSPRRVPALPLPGSEPADRKTLAAGGS
jgi:hypothetical protein